jgi:hypothetical protein
MSNPTQLLITYVSTPPSTTSTATVAIPAALVSLNASQDVTNATGYDSVDVLVSSIFKRGYVYNGATVIPASAIISITSQ